MPSTDRPANYAAHFVTKNKSSKTAVPKSKAKITVHSMNDPANLMVFMAISWLMWRQPSSARL
jgi:ATP-dependent Clp protease adapter protein ClpS